MKKQFWLCALIPFALILAASASEKTVADWNTDTQGWFPKADGVELAHDASSGCLQVQAPPGWQLTAKNDHVGMGGVASFSVRVRVVKTQSPWVSLGVIIQSSENGWDERGFRHVPLDGKWHTLSWNVDPATHKGASWSQLTFVFSSKNGAAFELDDLKSSSTPAKDGDTPPPAKKKEPPAWQTPPPEMTAAYLVAPRLLCVEVDAGRVQHPPQVPYKKQPGDRAEKKDARTTFLVRDGKRIGFLGGKNSGFFTPFDVVSGAMLDTVAADQAASWTIRSRKDSAYATGAVPVSVSRKTRPVDWAEPVPWLYRHPVKHSIYLTLPEPLTPGCDYTVSMTGGPSANTFTFNPDSMFTEAIHVSFIGFHPDDPEKAAYLSTWAGSGGVVHYPEDMPFRIVSQPGGQTVFRGTARLAKAADVGEGDGSERNYNGTDVCKMDFSALKKPGTYKVCVDGIGTSFPFEIGSNVWKKAFTLSARGFYHQRSGIRLGPPFTTYERPLGFIPGKGMEVFQSSVPLMDTGNGLNARQTDRGNFANLVKGKTDQPVSNAWGAYMDAGDWDRRIQHLGATRLLLEILDLYPAFGESVKLNIPESGNALPDLVDEARWNIDCYKRMQMPDGGIRGGIESADHPLNGECSWQESQDVMAYAPGIWSSFIYAGDAARLTHVLMKYDAGLAAEYRESALRAMGYAERELPRNDYAELPHQVNDARNLAALELFRLTGETTWHNLFLETTAFDEPRQRLESWQLFSQRDAAFLYLLLDPGTTDPAVRGNIKTALFTQADGSVELAGSTAFGWTKTDSWAPIGWGALSAPQAIDIVRAYHLSGERRYLQAAIRACGYGAGANPMNMALTTGLGPRSPRWPLVIDMRLTGQLPPPGITINGPVDISKGSFANAWPIADRFGVMKDSLYPSKTQWPVVEFFFDIYNYPMMNEFTVHGTMARSAYVWGMIAAAETSRK